MRDDSICRLFFSSLIASATPIALGATAIALALTTQRLTVARGRLPRRVSIVAGAKCTPTEHDEQRLELGKAR